MAGTVGVVDGGVGAEAEEEASLSASNPQLSRVGAVESTKRKIHLLTHQKVVMAVKMMMTKILMKIVKMKTAVKIVLKALKEILMKHLMKRRMFIKEQVVICQLCLRKLLSAERRSRAILNLPNPP